MNNNIDLDNAEKIATIEVLCGKPLEVGQTPDGFLRVIPIIGGVSKGKISGEVIPGGADWNYQKENGVAHVHARYTLRTDDGELILVNNEGYLDSNSFGNKAKTTPSFATDLKGRYGWMNYGAYAGGLEPGEAEGTVIITFYRLP